MRLLCPEHLNLKAIPRTYRDKAVYLLSTIKTRPVFDKRLKENNPERWIPLKASILQDNIGQRYYKRTIQICLDNKWIEIDRHYQPGVSCRKYKLSDNLKNDSWHIYKDISPVFSKTLDKQLKQNYDEFPAIYQYVCNNLKAATIEIPQSVYDGLNSENRLMVDMIKDRSWFYTLDDYGRLHNNLTNLPNRTTKLRQYIRLDGKPLEQIDRHASQPLTLGILIRHLVEDTKINFNTSGYSNFYLEQYKVKLNGRAGSNSSYYFLSSLLSVSFSLPYDMTFIQTELTRWFDLICSGNFYKYLQRETGLEHIPKSEFKNEIFFAALYGPIVKVIANDNVRAVNECLHKHFPNMMLIVDHIKRRGQDTTKKYITKNGKHILLDNADNSHAILPKLMQLMEADFMYNKVCQRIKEVLGIKCLTIHDAILVPLGYGEKAKEIMMECHSKYNLKPLLKVEPV
jgi:hypothetical protein